MAINKPIKNIKNVKPVKSVRGVKLASPRQIVAENRNWSKLVFNIILLVVLLGVLIFIGLYLYQNIPGEVENFEISNYIDSVDIPEVASGNKVIPFYSNLKFNHNKISYFFDASCEEERKERMLESFNVLQESVGAISFFSGSESEADILIGCSEEYLEKEENLFIAGEGGPTEIVNTTQYNIIQKGKILLYRVSECDYPVVELHELLHVFGFDHVNYSSDLMYSIYSCEQRINEETIGMLNYLYSIENLPDLYFSNVNATKKGRYLDFEVEVLNKGLSLADGVSLEVYSEDKEMGVFDLEDMEAGWGKTFSVNNLKLSSRNVKSVKLVLVSNQIELNEKNNEIELELS